MDELGRVEKAFAGSGVKPGEAAPENFHVQFAAFEIDLVDRGDFKLAACRGLDGFGDLDHVIVIEIKSGDGEIGFRLFGLFLDRYGASVLIEFDDAESFGVFDHVTENGCAIRSEEHTSALQSLMRP